MIELLQDEFDVWFVQDQLRGHPYHFLFVELFQSSAYRALKYVFDCLLFSSQFVSHLLQFLEIVFFLLVKLINIIQYITTLHR